MSPFVGYKGCEKAFHTVSSPLLKKTRETKRDLVAEIAFVCVFDFFFLALVILLVPPPGGSHRSRVTALYLSSQPLWSNIYPAGETDHPPAYHTQRHDPLYPSRSIVVISVLICCSLRHVLPRTTNVPSNPNTLQSFSGSVARCIARRISAPGTHKRPLRSHIATLWPCCQWSPSISLCPTR